VVPYSTVAGSDSASLFQVIVIDVAVSKASDQDRRT